MAAAKTYTALVGLNYPTAKGEARAEAGDVVSDLPTKSVAWLRDQGLITAGQVEVAEVVADDPDAEASATDEQEGE